MCKNSRWRLLLPSIWLGLSGCTYPQDVYLTGRASGVTAHTEVVTFASESSGEAALTLKGKKYTGRWVYMSGDPFAPPGAGTGTMNFTAPDGSSLHCMFQYSEWSRSGVGVCEASDGEIYDVQIS